MGMSLKADTLNITHDILSLIAELDEFKGAWRALGTLAPERLSALHNHKRSLYAVQLIFIG